MNRLKDLVATFSIALLTYMILMPFIVHEPYDAYGVAWWMWYASPYSNFFYYLFGFWAGQIFVRLNGRWSFSTPLFIQRLVFTVLEVLALLLMFTNYFYFFNFPSVYNNRFIVTTLFTIFIFAFSKGYLSRLFSVKIAVSLGKASASIYLLHQLMIEGILYLNGGHLEMGRFAALMWFVAITCVCVFYSEQILPVVNRLLTSLLMRNRPARSQG